MAAACSRRPAQQAFGWQPERGPPARASHPHARSLSAVHAEKGNREAHQADDVPDGHGARLRLRPQYQVMLHSRTSRTCPRFLPRRAPRAAPCTRPPRARRLFDARRAPALLCSRTARCAKRTYGPRRTIGGHPPHAAAAARQRLRPHHLRRAEPLPADGFARDPHDGPAGPRARVPRLAARAGGGVARLHVVGRLRALDRPRPRVHGSLLRPWWRAAEKGPDRGLPPRTDHGHHGPRRRRAADDAAAGAGGARGERGGDAALARTPPPALVLDERVQPSAT
eukprot:4928778-Prymnesium_polylepis.2